MELTTHDEPITTTTTKTIISDSTGQASPETKTAGADAISSPVESTIDTPGKPIAGGPTLNVPPRSSSNASVNPMIEQTTIDPTSTSEEVSKGSIKPKSRSGSAASNKPIEKETEEEKATPSTDQGKLESDDQQATSQKLKKRGGLFSFLNCCKPPENANTVELGDQAVPAKKAKVLQQKPGRQPTPIVKANASAGESSTGESKEITEENIGGPEYSELKPAAKPTMITRASKDKVLMETPSAQANPVEPVAESEEPLAALETHEPQSPPLPASNLSPPEDTKTGQGMSAGPLAAATVSPPPLVEPDQSVEEQGAAINDRTPEQEYIDNDIVMVDAPPLAPTTDESSNTTRELTQAQINLPPPPPRNGQDRAASGSSAQQWLLPPLQPRFKGRKCLVLDLDETLVHSSFKVGHTNSSTKRS